MSTDFPEYPKMETLYNRGIGGVCQIDQWRTPEFEYLKENNWVWTEKVDGTNVRVWWNGSTVSFGGRTDAAQMYVPLLTRLTALFPSEKFANFPAPTVLYGEGYGAKTQKGGENYKADGVDFVLFDARIREVWVPFQSVQNIATTLGIRSVPVVGRGTLSAATELVRQGFNSVWGNFPAEGLVVRPDVPLLDRRRQRIIGKLKHRDF